MSFRKLEADFQRKLNEYKSTYQDYMATMKTGQYWNTQSNMMVSNPSESARINFTHEADISKIDCLHNCASDKNCKYVLFSDSGNGECAANQCLKWTSEAGNLESASSKPIVSTIYVGSSNSNPKVVTLPEVGMTVYSTPINPQQSSWRDTFQTSVSDNQLTVTRVDQNSGWGQQLELQAVKAPEGVKEYTIQVGSSGSNPKIVTLPDSGLVVSPIGVDRQNPGWSDRFKVDVSGTQLTVTRIDQNSGWGQDLEFRAFKGLSSGVIQTNYACDGTNGPRETNYVYEGWDRPDWEVSENVSFFPQGTPQDNNEPWVNLGFKSSLDECQNAAIESEKGPFTSVTFFNLGRKKCYASLPEAQLSNVNMKNAFSSVPPLGSTNLGGKDVMHYVLKLKMLNSELLDDVNELENQLQNSEKDVDESIREKTHQAHKDLMSDLKKLKRDKEVLEKMEHNLNTLDAKSSILARTTTRQKILFFFAVILLLLVLGFLIKRSS